MIDLCQLSAYSCNKAMVDRIVRPTTPWIRVTLASAVVYRTGRNQYHVAGVSGRQRHCSEAASVASRRFLDHYRKM